MYPVHDVQPGNDSFDSFGTKPQQHDDSEREQPNTVIPNRGEELTEQGRGLFWYHVTEESVHSFHALRHGQITDYCGQKNESREQRHNEVVSKAGCKKIQVFAFDVLQDVNDEA